MDECLDRNNAKWMDLMILCPQLPATVLLLTSLLWVMVQGNANELTVEW
jgi:hypothetical protein